jgi:ABC-type multidrug transport system fused ATPase/permease subunit
MIARAILKNPAILVTDEATSALDAETEMRVQEALDEVIRNRTALIIAHRLSTIRNAHMIYVFEEGEIKEAGTHDELVLRKSHYYNLVHRQIDTGFRRAESETNST